MADEEVDHTDLLVETYSKLTEEHWEQHNGRPDVEWGVLRPLTHIQKIQLELYIQTMDEVIANPPEIDPQPTITQSLSPAAAKELQEFIKNQVADDFLSDVISETPTFE